MRRFILLPAKRRISVYSIEMFVMMDDGRSALANGRLSPTHNRLLLCVSVVSTYISLRIADIHMTKDSGRSCGSFFFYLYCLVLRCLPFGVWWLLFGGGGRGRAAIYCIYMWISPYIIRKIDSCASIHQYQSTFNYTNRESHNKNDSTAASYG